MMPPDIGLRFMAVTLDCLDVDRLAGFWSALVGLPLREPLPEWRRLGPLAGGPLLTFQPVPWTTPGRSDVHIDLATADGEAAAARVVLLCGSSVEEHHYDEGTVRVGVASRTLTVPPPARARALRMPTVPEGTSPTR